jgi:hypothetical protein
MLVFAATPTATWIVPSDLHKLLSLCFHPFALAANGGDAGFIQQLSYSHQGQISRRLLIQIEADIECRDYIDSFAIEQARGIPPVLDCRESRRHEQRVAFDNLDVS